MFWFAGFVACGWFGKEPEVPVVTDAEQEAFAELVSGATEGTVGRRTKPRVRLVQDAVTAEAVGQPVGDGVLTFEPAIDGVARWSDPREILLEPAGDLAPGTTYTGSLDLGKLDPANTGKVFRFQFTVLTQALQHRDLGLRALEKSKYAYESVVTTADDADDAAVEQTLRAEQDGKPLAVTWTHATPREHQVTIGGIARSEQPSTLTLTWDPGPIGGGEAVTETVTVPARGAFALTQWRAAREGEQYVELRFTEVLKKDQNLAGLVRVLGMNTKSLRFEIDGSVLKVFSSERWVDGDHTVEVDGVRDAEGRRLPARSVDVSFGPLKPAVRFATDGVVLPSRADLTLPLEVTNVRAVTIEATQVFDDNVPQFLQVNDLGGSRELQRVGRVVWRQRVPVPGGDAGDRPLRIGVDVSELVRRDPHALYRLSVSFQRADIVYDCASASWQPAAAEPPAPDDAWADTRQAQRDASYWDSSEEDSAYWDWHQRDNPCSAAYYRDWGGDHPVEVSKNVLVSDLGLVAKLGNDHELVVAATHLATTAPMEVDLRVLDAQLQEIAVGRTGPDGFARLELSRRPFLVEARADGQIGYVKTDAGSALSVSHFDTGGENVARGVKGWFYGERGVWRPGDDVFLTFVLDDETKKLPKDHPLHFELVGPTGRIVERRTVTQTADGFFDLHTRTPASAPTGTWTARADVGGRVFTTPLEIQAVMPNRLKIGFEFDQKVVTADDRRLKTTLRSRWLHGAKASDLKAAMEVRLLRKATAFPAFPQHVFDDPTMGWVPEQQTLWEGSLDAEGLARIDEPLSVAEGAPGLLSAEITTRVFEPSGAFSVDKTQLDVSPYDRYVGIRLPKGDVARNMLLTDTKHTVDVVTVGPDGKPAGDGDVEWKLYKVGWRWWWEKGEDTTLVDYTGSASHKPIAEGTASVAGGRGKFPFEIKYPDWGRYLLVVQDRGGHRAATTMYVDWPGWAGRPAADNPGGASVLSVSTDKDRLNVGEEFHVSFPTPKGGGRALLSLETGTGVVSTQWVVPTGDTVSVPIVATSEMAPSVYAHVTVIQPHGAANDLPIRLYGVAPVQVEDPGTRLAPAISTADTWSPEATARVQVTEKDGRAMTYTLEVVDEGLLGLTRFRTPDPWPAFYGREALGVRTWDLYDQVMGAFGGVLDGMLAIGGSDEVADTTAKAQPQAKRFPPMVRHYGPFTLGPGETATHEVDVPAYVGEVRVMVIGGHDGAYGSTEKAVTVKKPLMVLATLPRVLGPGETLTVPVDVFALEASVKDVTVTLAAEGPVALAGSATQRLSFASPGERLATFGLRAKDELGIARITATAEGGGQKATQVIELGVRHPGVRQTDVVHATVEPGSVWEQPLRLRGIPGSNAATLEVGRVPPLDLGRHLEMLIQYPHGCIEQTTSSVFPQMLLPAVTELTADQRTRIQSNVKAGIQRLTSFQTPTGGFGYWPGDREANPWGTSYAGHFLLEAERNGYVLPPGLRKAWVAHQRTAANVWTRHTASDDLDQAFRLYTLALAGDPDLAAMNRLREIPDLGTVARYRLAAAYELAGQPEAARKLISGLDGKVRAYRETGDTYGSDLRDRALILETLVALKDPAAPDLARAVSADLSKDRWYATQEAAVALVALSRFGVSQPGTLAFTWSAGSASGTVSSAKAVAKVDLPLDAAGGPVKVSGGQGPLFVELVTSGLPKVGPQSAGASGLSLDVAYENLNGGAADPASLRQGTDVLVKVKVGNETGRNLEELALSQVVPSSWEIFGTSPGKGDGYDYRDVRDDRVYTYFDLPAGQSRELVIRVNAAYLGHTFLAPVAVEAMYDASISAHTAGAWVDVVDAER